MHCGGSVPPSASRLKEHAPTAGASTRGWIGRRNRRVPIRQWAMPRQGVVASAHPWGPALRESAHLKRAVSYLLLDEVLRGLPLQQVRVVCFGCPARPTPCSGRAVQYRHRSHALLGHLLVQQHPSRTDNGVGLLLSSARQLLAIRATLGKAREKQPGGADGAVTGDGLRCWHTDIMTRM